MTIAKIYLTTEDSFSIDDYAGFKEVGEQLGFYDSKEKFVAFVNKNAFLYLILSQDGNKPAKAKSIHDNK